MRGDFGGREVAAERGEHSSLATDYFSQRENYLEVRTASVLFDDFSNVRKSPCFEKIRSRVPGDNVDSRLEQLFTQSVLENILLD